VDLGDWGIRHWRLLSGLITALLVALGGLVGGMSEYGSRFPALGGPNGLLYDVVLSASQPLRRRIPTAPAVFVAIDDASLTSARLARLPRALFQPIWAELIDGLIEAGARRIAFDVVFAYAGADFRVGEFTLPDYDRDLIESLRRHRDRIVLGRFPSVAPAPAFVRTMGASRIGVLDLRLETDGRVRSAAPLARLPGGRIALGFAALGAGLSIRQASALERLLIVPHAPLVDTPSYSLSALLECLASPEGRARVREAVEGSIVVVGTAVLGEDEHRGPTRFLRHPARSDADGGCAPQPRLLDRHAPDVVPGALLQIGAIQSAASQRPLRLAPAWMRLAAGAGLALVFALLAFRDESALAIGERGVARGQMIVLQLMRSLVTGLAGPVILGLIVALAAFNLADLWLPMGYPIVATVIAFGAIVGIRSVRHRTYFRRLYRTTGRYLPPERLVTLARSGFADPPEGQEREVSILLADLVGFTSFSNEPGRTASEVVRVANSYFTAMQAAIDRHDGCSDKFLGDAVLAFWNGLSDEPAHALKALAAARDIMATVSRPGIAGDFRLGARAVVCSGRVYVGDLGARERSNFTIIGPAVNETFRLEKVPDLYGLPLLVAASTAQLIEAARHTPAGAQVLGSHVLVRVDEVELKGFAAPESIYTLVPRDDPGLVAFQAAREALDAGMIVQGLARLRAVEGGLLQQAAKVVAARLQSAEAAQ
jgi:adenylate cyclase